MIPLTADATARPFRFAVGGPASVHDRVALVRHVQTAERVGYSTATFPDHHFMPISPLVAMSVAAAATTDLRLGSFVLATDLRHPAMLAKDIASLDVLSDGRVELGLGAGWIRSDFDTLGIPFADAGTRITRVEEAVAVIRGAWSGEPFDFTGSHLRIAGLVGVPRPRQVGGPPVLVGGGGRKMLEAAARCADIVTIAARPLESRTVSVSDAESLRRRVKWIADASDGRPVVPERHVLLGGIAVTDDRRGGARAVVAQLAATARRLALRPIELSEDDILSSPFFAVGSVPAIVEQLLALREETGISYISVPSSALTDFGPVVEALTGR